MSTGPNYLCKSAVIHLFVFERVKEHRHYVGFHFLHAVGTNICIPYCSGH